MQINSKDSLGVIKTLTLSNKSHKYFDLSDAATKLGFKISKLPYSLRVLFENTLRMEDGKNNDDKTLIAYKDWLKTKSSSH